MALSMLVALVAAPALLGTQEAIRQSQSKDKREEHRARRCNLIANCVKSSARRQEIDGRLIVLRGGKLYIDTGIDDDRPFGHPFAGYYLPYPDTKYEGLVTTVTDVAPILNWVYIDQETYELKYGVRADAQPNITGPFDCTRQDRRMTHDGWEGWCAVEEYPSIWALYFDKNDDGLRSKVAPGTRVLEIELTRKEKRWAKETPVRHQDQTTQRSVDTKEEAPLDDPVVSEAQIDPPGAPKTEEVRPKPFALPKSIFTDNTSNDTGTNGLSFPIPKSIFDTDANTLDAAQTSETGAAPKPFALPKSIFADEAPPPYSPVAPVVQSKPEHRPATPDSESPRRTSSEYSPVRDSRSSPLLTSDEVPVDDILPPKSTPKVFTRSPVQTSNGKAVSRSSKTGQVRRVSGTKALARAQMFEALSQNKNDSPPRKETSRSRSSSQNGGSPTASVRSTTDRLLSYYARPDSSVLTPSAPGLQQSQNLSKPAKDLPKQPSSLADPAVFPASVEDPNPRVQSRERARTTEKSAGQNLAQRKDSLSKGSSREPPKETLPPLPRQSSVNRTGSKQNRRADAAPPPLQPKTSTRETPRAEVVEKRKPAAQGLARTMSRSAANPASTISDLIKQRQRNNSEASNPPSRVTGRPRAGTETSTARQNMAAATSAPTDRASAVRNGSVRRASPVMDPPASNGRSTTSKLYRELDDILKPIPRQNSRDTSSRTGTTRREDRPQLRRAYTAPRPRSPA